MLENSSDLQTAQVLKTTLTVRHGGNSIPELMANSNSGIDYLKKMELELINRELELKFPKNNYAQINLPLNVFIQKYFFHDNATWNINYSEQVF